MLIGVDAAALERALLAWQEQLLGPAQDPLVIVDGKTLRQAHLELVSAVNGQGRWLGTVAVPEGSNEIPTARQLLTKVSVPHKTTLPTRSTPNGKAQPMLFEGGGVAFRQSPVFLAFTEMKMRRSFATFRQLRRCRHRLISAESAAYGKWSQAISLSPHRAEMAEGVGRTTDFSRVQSG